MNLNKILILIFVPLGLSAQSKEIIHDQLSEQFDISITQRINTTQNPDLDSIYLKVVIYKKGSKRILQTIRKNKFNRWEDDYSLAHNTRSYQTGYNAYNAVVDGIFGNLVVADLNFDGLDDFAFTYDWGVTNGPHYYFYQQESDGHFIRNVFLCDEMGYFPHIIDAEKQQLTTLTHANAHQTGKTVFQYYPESKSWKLKSRELLGG